MTTKITLNVQGDGGQGPKVIYLAESFDAVIDKVFPLQQPGSALEARIGMIYEAHNGDRIWIPHSYIATIEENVAVGE